MGKLSSIPAMPHCTSCGHCCGPATMNKAEAKRMRRFVEDNQVEWLVSESEPQQCGFLRDDSDGAGTKFSCAVYEVRPWVCRAFGVYKELECKFFPEDAAIGGSFPAEEAAKQKLITEKDGFIGEYFEPQYVERLFSWMREETTGFQLNGHNKVPLSTARDIAFRGLIKEFQQQYPGPFETLPDRLSPADLEVLELFMRNFYAEKFADQLPIVVRRP